jgi:hypothetical protein
MQKFSLATAAETAAVLTAAALSLASTAAAAGGADGYGNAQDTIDELRAQGFNVQINGAEEYPLSRCEVTGIEGMHNDNIRSDGTVIDAKKLTTVWVDITCEEGG